MQLFDVYPLFDINIVRGKGCHVWDDQGSEYLDLYGGHAVISIGHSHPHYVEMISKQVAQLGFYSNSVINKLQVELAERLCGYDDYQLFLINSGAEANENALKLASFQNGRTRVVSFGKAFHGRTSLAVEVTDNPKIIAPINDNGHTTYLPLNDVEAMREALSSGDVCAAIIEGIQGSSSSTKSRADTAGRDASSPTNGRTRARTSSPWPRASATASPWAACSSARSSSPSTGNWALRLAATTWRARQHWPCWTSSKARD